MDIDAPTASIITDRCTPPAGLGPAPSTIKAVLWCIRGLGAPGSDLCIPADLIQRRTCLSVRAVRSVMSTLREHGILTLTRAPSPGQSSRYQLDYAKLSEWVDPADLDATGIKSKSCPRGSTRPRSEAPRAADRGHRAPPSKSTAASHAPSAAPRAPSAASPAGDIKEETAEPAKPSSSSAGIDFEHAESMLAAAAAGGEVQGVEDWTKIAKAAGHERDLAAQLATVVESQGIRDRERGLNALERLSERLAGGGVKNPTGLLRTLLRDCEPSQRSAGRKRRRDHQAGKFVEAVHAWNLGHYDFIERRVYALLEVELGFEVARVLMPEKRFKIPLAQWRAMIDFICPRWEEIRTMSSQPNGVV